jgi:hypothetical protein
LKFKCFFRCFYFYSGDLALFDKFSKNAKKNAAKILELRSEQNSDKSLTSFAKYEDPYFDIIREPTTMNQQEMIFFPRGCLSGRTNAKRIIINTQSARNEELSKSSDEDDSPIRKSSFGFEKSFNFEKKNSFHLEKYKNKNKKGKYRRNTTEQAKSSVSFAKHTKFEGKDFTQLQKMKEIKEVSERSLSSENSQTELFQPTIYKKIYS